MKNKFNKQNAFGVELELLIPCTITQSTVVDKLRDAGINARKEGYNHDTVSYWKMTTDCTVKSLGMTYYQGNNELVSPKLYGEEGKAELRKVLEVLNELGCRVNKTCGTHVHHDVTDIMLLSQRVVEKFLNNLILTVIKYEHLIYRLIAPSRLQKIGRGYWTQPARLIFARSYDPSVESIKKSVKDNIKYDCSRKYRREGAGVNTRITPGNTQSNRYCGLNLKNIWTRGSVEFRYHQGTLNFEKLWAWIVFTQAIVNSVQNKKSINFKTQEDQHGMFHLRKAIGFIGSKDRCEDYKFANKVILKRFKEMTTATNNRRRSRPSPYSLIKGQLKRSI